MNTKIKYGGIFEKKKPVVPINYQSCNLNIEADSLIELSELQTAFRDQAQKEKDRQDKNTDAEFFSCIIFKSKQQRDQFYELLGMKEEDNQYINGEKLAKAIELKIEEIELKSPGKFKCNREIYNLAMEL